MQGLTHDGDIITQWVVFARLTWPQTQMIVIGGLDWVVVAVTTCPKELDGRQEQGIQPANSSVSTK